MINIDTVYQQVLALANKEQRGYITPQEFNLFANLAQQDIFEQYFYDLHQFKRLNDNDNAHTNMQQLIEEKIQFFEVTAGTATIGTWTGNTNPISKLLPSSVYRVHRVTYNGRPSEILNTVDFNKTRNSGPLVAPTDTRTVCNIRGNRIRLLGSGGIFLIPGGVVYSRKPNRVTWGYVVVNEKALYDPQSSSNFELHQSEEPSLVYKILKYAGISIKNPDVIQAGGSMEISQIQQEKQ